MAAMTHRYSELQVYGGRFRGLVGLLRAAEGKARAEPRLRIDWPIHGVLAAGPFAGAREEVGRLRIHDGEVTLEGVEPDEGEPVHPDRDRHGPDAGGLGLGDSAAGAVAPPPRGLMWT